MFGAIKKIFKRGKSSNEESPASTPAVAEQNAGGTESFAPEAATYVPADGDSGESLRVSLKALVAGLPKELQGKNTPGANEVLVLPREQVLEQLAQGAVKVPFGQVRRLASNGVLAGGSSHDNRMVDVPLKEILAQLRPDLLPRRADQRVITVPDEISDIFGAKGEARAQMRILQKDELKPAARSETPAPAPQQPTPMPVYQTPTAASFGAPALPQQERIAISPGPAAARPSAIPVTPMAPIQRAEFLIFSIAEISANWPNAVKQEIQRLGAQNSKCLLPTVEIQEALKQGRVSYTWKQISGKLQPALSPSTQISNEDAVLELPIASVASAFFTQTQGNNASRPVVKPPSNIEPLFKAGPTAPTPQAAPIPARPVAPAPPLAAPAPIQPTPQLRLQQEAPLPPQQPIAAPALPQAPRPANAPVPAVASKGNVVFKVSDVWAGWPEEIKAEVNKLKIAGTKVAIPFEMVEQGLRSGKIEFSWADFCVWVENFPLEAQGSAVAQTRISLPLPVVAPLCLRLSPPTQRKAPTLDDIPDVFAAGGDAAEAEEEDAPMFQKGPAPAAKAPATPTARPTLPPAPAPAPPPPRAPAPPPQPQRVAHTHAHAPAAHGPDPGTTAKNLAELFGEAGKRNWTPNEIVQRTAQLPGVSGALIALQDGLLVANCMPTTWKSETIAAFLPQIFGRMSQYVKELSMGDLISVTVAVEQGTLQVYKAGIIYFAALAKPDGTMPLAALNLIARELSRHTK